MRSRLTFLLAVLLAAAASALAFPSSGAAHLALVDTTPSDGASLDAPVERVTLEFTVPGDPVGPGIRVLDQDGAPVPATVRTSDGGTTFTAVPDSPLEGGRFGVAWRVAAPDAHPISGSFTFTVAAAAGGAPAEPDAGAAPTAPGAGTDPPEAPAPAGADPLAAALETPDDSGADALGTLGRVLAYGGGLVAIGGLAFLAFAAVGGRRELARLFAALRVAGLVVLAGGAVGVLARAWLLEGDLGSAFSPSALRAALEDEAGLALIATMAGGLLVALGARAAFRAAPRVALAAGDWEGGGRRVVAGSLRNAWLGVAGAIVIMLGIALDGHSASEGPRVLVWAADFSHVLAVGVWAGGLALLTAVLVGRRRAGRPANAAFSAVRFATLAGAGLAVAGLSGIVLAIVILPEPSALWDTTWGLLLLAKVAVVAVVASMGAYNHFRLIPSLEARLGARPARSRAATRDPQPTGDGVATLVREDVATMVPDTGEEIADGLRRNALVEVGLLVAVVILTAILVGASAV